MDERREQPAREPVGDNHHRSEGEHRLRRARRARVAQQGHRPQEDAEIENLALHGIDHRSGQRRPGERYRAPCRESRQAGHGQPSRHGGRERQRPEQGQPEHDAQAMMAATARGPSK